MPYKYRDTNRINIDPQTTTGAIVEIDNSDNLLDLIALSVALEPIQDLNGYDKPWVGGAGVNKAKLDQSKNTNHSAWTYSSDVDNSVVGTRTATGGMFLAAYTVTLTNGTKYYIGGTFTNITQFYIYSDRTWGTLEQTVQNNKSSFTYTGNTGTVVIGVYANTNLSASVNNFMITTSATSTYYPYENICPISGHTEVDVVVSPTTDAEDGNTYTTVLGQTVYGGTLDVVSGVLTVTHGNIASYNGETLPSTWISDRDVYASGTTPTTGAQVVYELATPLTYQLTAQQIKTLVGTNNVWASSGDIVSIKFTYGGLLSELPSDATSVVGKCYCDVEQNGVSSMPFTLNVEKNERES